MMARLCAYAEKVFSLGSRMAALRDSRRRPVIPTTGVFASAFVMFATGRGALHGLESDLRIPARLRGLVGPRQPSCDTIGRVYAGMDSLGLRERSSNTTTAAWCAIWSGMIWRYHWTSSCSAPAKAKKRPPNVSWSGCSPSTAASSTWWWGTPSIWTPPS